MRAITYTVIINVRYVLVSVRITSGVLSTESDSQGRGSRRRRGSLTRDEIATVTLSLIDADGVDALTMRGIAEALGASPMSLYVHVRNKQEVIQAAVDLVLASIAPADINADPIDGVLDFFERLREEMVKHPGVADTILSMPLQGSATFAVVDAVLHLLDRAGLSDDDALAATVALFSYTLGFTQLSLRPSNVSPELAAEHADQLRRVDPHRFPSLHRASGSLLDGLSRQQFAKGLRGIIAGLIVDGVRLANGTVDT